MSRVTRFASRDDGTAARVAGFIAHLRDNGLRLGVAETGTALQALREVEAAQPETARAALRAVCTGCAEDAKRFDDLFDSYWMNGGRVRARQQAAPQATAKHTHNSRDAAGHDPASGAGAAHSPDDTGATGEVSVDGTGKLVATTATNLMKKDLRDLVAAQDIRAAEAVALRLGRALRDKRSRRRRAARNGDRIDFRRIMRRGLAQGGEPFELPMRERPDRPVKIAALCDVSGSMTIYARVFLAFLAGLLRADPTADAYLFHTRLTRVTDALRDDDPMRALNRLTLLADGFGGGSKIGGNLAQFARSYARRFVDGRTLVLIFSDGYDTDPPEDLANALAMLRKRGCRIVWLNPLKGWQGYEPVAAGMAAALPYLDAFVSANTLNDLAALEPRFARL